MNSPARVAMYVALLSLGLACMPGRLIVVASQAAVLGLFCMVLVQLRTTRNVVDRALACTAFWVLCAILLAPVYLVSGWISAFLVGGGR